MTRREFIAATAAATAAATLPADEKKPPRPIVDTHQHLWDLKKFRLPWIKKGSPLDHSFVLEGLRQGDRGAERRQGGLHGSGRRPGAAAGRGRLRHRAVQERQDDHSPRSSPAGRTSDGFAKYARQFKGSKYVKGIRQVLHVDGHAGGLLPGQEFVAGIRLLGELGLSFDLCMRPAELPDAPSWSSCPDTRFILDHCGNADVQAKTTRSGRGTSRRSPSTRTWSARCPASSPSAKPKEWTADDLAPVVNHTLDVFGPDRVMFGGDWPVCTLAATYRSGSRR